MPSRIGTILTAISMLKHEYLYLGTYLYLGILMITVLIATLILAQYSKQIRLDKTVVILLYKINQTEIVFSTYGTHNYVIDVDFVVSFCKLQTALLFSPSLSRQPRRRLFQSCQISLV